MEDFIILYIIISLLMTGLGKMLLKNWINPISIFSGLFLIIITLYSYHFYGLHYASDQALKCIFMGSISFSIGGLLRIFLFNKKKRNKNFILEKMDATNYNLVLMMNIIVLIIVIFMLPWVIKMLRSGYSFSYIHIVWDTEESSLAMLPGYALFVFQYIVRPWIVALPTVFSVILYADDKSRKRFIVLVLSAVDILLYSVISGGRGGLVFLLLQVFLAALLLGKTIKLTWKYRIGIIIIIIMATVLFLKIESARGGDAIRTFYVYVCGCVPFLSKKLDYVKYAFNNRLFYGTMTTYGFVRIVKPIFIRMGLFTTFFNEHILAFDTQGREVIGKNLSYNAFVTPFYYFYNDFGYLGVCLFSFIYGYISVKIRDILYKTRSLRSFAMYLFVLFGLVTSMIRFQFVFYINVIALIYIMLVFPKKQRN